MLGKVTTALAAAALLATAQGANAGGSYFAGSTATLDSLSKASTGIVQVQRKKCKFVDADGYVYRDYCPRGVKKGSRKKRAGFGALIGAGVGAAIGAGVGGGRGAAIGAGVGAGVGAASGAASVKKCWYRDRNGRRYKARCRQ